MHIKFVFRTPSIAVKQNLIRPEFAIFMSTAGRRNKPCIFKLNLFDPTDSVILLSMVDELTSKRFFRRIIMSYVR